MKGQGVLGIVLDIAVQTEESGRACALAKLSGFMYMTELASPVARYSLVCNAIITPTFNQPFHS